MANKNTYFVIVTDFNDSDLLEDAYLLGCDNKYDWYADDVDGQDLITPTGRLKKSNGVCIEVDRWVGAYVSTDKKWMLETCKDAMDEGYGCCCCEIVNTVDGLKLEPVL
jgi:hypothetical protein